MLQPVSANIKELVQAIGDNGIYRGFPRLNKLSRFEDVLALLAIIERVKRKMATFADSCFFAEFRLDKNGVTVIEAVIADAAAILLIGRDECSVVFFLIFHSCQSLRLDSR